MPTQQRHTGLELQLRLGQVQAFAIHGNIVAVGPGDQPIHLRHPHLAGSLSLVHFAHGLAHFSAEIHAYGTIAGRIDVGHIGRSQLGLARGQIHIARHLIAEPGFDLHPHRNLLLNRLVPAFVDCLLAILSALHPSCSTFWRPWILVALVDGQAEVDLPRGDGRSLPGKNGAALQHMLQFAHVPRPGMGGQLGQSGRIDTLDRILSAHLLKKCSTSNGRSCACSDRDGVRMRKTARR